MSLVSPTRCTVFSFVPVYIVASILGCLVDWSEDIFSICRYMSCYTYSTSYRASVVGIVFASFGIVAGGRSTTGETISVSKHKLVSRQHELQLVHVRSAQQHVDPLTKALHILLVCACISLRVF